MQKKDTQNSLEQGNNLSYVATLFVGIDEQQDQKIYIILLIIGNTAGTIWLKVLH